MTEKIDVSQQHSLSAAAKWFLLSDFVTNIGNGMHTIAIAKLLYDRTGSATAFAAVIIVEYFLTVLMSIFAGSIVDRGNPKTVCAVTDLIRGAFILLSFGFMQGENTSWWMVLASVAVINIGKPFYRSAIFAIGPRIAEGTALLRYNGLSGSMLQTGQLLGTGLAGIVISHWGSPVAFALNGVSFIIAGLFVFCAKIVPLSLDDYATAKALKNINILNEWKSVFAVLRQSKSFGFHILLCAGDYLAVSLANLALVPLVALRYGGNAYWLAAFDGGFAVGSILMSIGIVQASARLTTKQMVQIGLLAQGILFACLAWEMSPFLVVMIMLLLGTANTLSLNAVLSSLQQRSKGAIKGKVASLRQLGVALSASVFLPLASSAYGSSLERGLMFSGLVCIIFACTVVISSRKVHFGEHLFEAT